jgi:peptide/nickel transport system permease protein
MAQYITKRIISGIIAFFLFTLIVFFAFNLLAPYDYVTTLSLVLSGTEAREALRDELGLNLPIWQQYFFWLGRLAQGNLGNEFTLFGRGRPVTEVLRESVPSTILVFLTSAFLAFWLGVWLGKITGWRPKKILSGTTTISSIALYTAFPPWLAFIMIFFMVDKLHWLPASTNLLANPIWREAPFTIPTMMLIMIGTFLAMVLVVMILAWLFKKITYRSLPSIALILIFLAGVFTIWIVGGYLSYSIEIMRIAFIPFLTFLLLAFGDTMLLMQSGIRDIKHEPYIQLARGIGVPEKRIRDKHASRNAMLPVMSRFVINLPYLLTAAVIIEQSTGWRGMGQVMFDTVYNQNTYVYMGMLIVVGLVSLIARLVLDIAYALLDPRIRYGKSGIRGVGA